MIKNNHHILVTGGAGFIGSYIASRLITEGYRVTIIDNLYTGKQKNIPRGADFINIDLGQKISYDYLKSITCDAVLHLAGQSSGEASFNDPLYDFQSHVCSTFWLLEWCKSKGVRRFIYSSSMSVYGEPKYLPVDENHPLEPKTFYATAKIAAEAYIRLYQTLGMDTTIVRLFSVYGPGQNLENKMQGMVSIFLSYLLENVPIIVKGSEDRFRDFIYIDDVVEAWFKILNNPVTFGKTYNLASGRKVRIAELLDMIKGVFGDQNYPIEYASGTPGDQFGIFANIDHVAGDLKWMPEFDLQTGLQKMIDCEKELLDRK